MLLLDRARDTGNRTTCTSACYEHVNFAGRRFRRGGRSGYDRINDLWSSRELVGQGVVDLSSSVVRVVQFGEIWTRTLRY